MIVIGRMAERYHMLPHQIAELATTYDYIIQDVLHSYDEYQSKAKQGGDLNTLVKTEDLQTIMERARG